MPTGRCHCGRVAYAFEGEIRDASCCHCSICRRLSGSAFGAYGAVAAERLRWTRGGDDVSIYRPSERLEKAFCPTCGSTLRTRHAQEPDQCFIHLGTLDEPEAVELLYHQFAGSKAPWHTIDDGLPQHHAWPPEQS